MCLDVNLWKESVVTTFMNTGNKFISINCGECLE